MRRWNLLELASAVLYNLITRSHHSKIVLYFLGKKEMSITLVCSNDINLCKVAEECVLLFCFLCSNWNSSWLPSSVNTNVNCQMARDGEIVLDHKYRDPITSSMQIHSEINCLVEVVIRISGSLFEGTTLVLKLSAADKNNIGLVDMVGIFTCSHLSALSTVEPEVIKIDDKTGVVVNGVVGSASFEE